jgi:hypothetical protein
MRSFSRRSVVLLVALWGACGSNDVGPTGHLVGARCASDKDCSKRCLIGASFPNGYCSQMCVTEKDCPGGTVCVMTDGDTGACLATCHVPGDCDGYGTGYQCNRQARQEGGEGALVCTGA